MTLREGQTRDGVDVVLPRRSTVTGTIVDEHGEPLADVMVQALHLRTVDGRTIVGVKPSHAHFSLASVPSRGAPVPDEPMNSLRPSVSVRSRPFARLVPFFAL